jgi:hypothetical protein
MAKVAKERLDAVRKYLQDVFPGWALAERWDDDHEAQTFMLKKPRESLHLLKVSRAVLEQHPPARLPTVLESHQVASALKKADKHRLILTQRGLIQI